MEGPGDFLPKRKVAELRAALENRHASAVVVYGPPRCGKTTLIAHTLRLLGLSAVEVENVATFEPRYLRRDEVGVVDQDAHVPYPPNVVVETRRFVRGALRMNAIPRTRQRPATGGYDAALCAVRGRAFVETVDVFQRLGRLFYKSEAVEVPELREYVHGSYLAFMALGEAREVAEALSLGLPAAALAACVRTRQKAKPRGFFPFRPSAML